MMHMFQENYKIVPLLSKWIYLKTIAASYTGSRIQTSITLINAILARMLAKIIELFNCANTFTQLSWRVISQTLRALLAKHRDSAANTIGNKTAASWDSIILSIIEDDNFRRLNTNTWTHLRNIVKNIIKTIMCFLFDKDITKRMIHMLD